jgi:hypothetical protein
VDDPAYNDYGLFGIWTTPGLFCVTRIKEKALYEMIGEGTIPPNRHILKDELILLKGLKQNLRIKTFMGTSANAVEIQIWTAMALYL